MHRLFLLLIFIGLQAAYGSVPTDSADDFSVRNKFLRTSSRGYQLSAKERWLKMLRTQNFDFTWNPVPNQPITRLEIRVSEQKAYVYQNDQIVGITPVSTGKEGHLTPLGKFSVLSKEVEHKSNLYGSFVNAQGRVVDDNADVTQTPPPGCHYVPAIMSHFLRLTDNGVGLHAGFIPGFAASHGCIRLPTKVASNFFDSIPVGTPVEVVP